MGLGGFGERTHTAKDWTLTARTGPISRDADVEALKERLGAASMPEQLFGNSFLRLTHSSGAVLDFNAADALAAWHAERVPPVQVAIASQWQQERKDAVAKVAALNYDWTFTTSYAGSLRPADSGPAAEDFAQPDGGGWQTSSDQPDMALLTARDPILFFVEVPLYESELDDNGTSQLSVKVRVMPSCWYILMRFFLRVDGTLVRLREARLFCDLRQPTKVVREMKHMEATLGQLSGNARGGRGAAHADADSAAVALNAIAPDGVRMFKTETLYLAQPGLS